VVASLLLVLGGCGRSVDVDPSAPTKSDPGSGVATVVESGDDDSEGDEDEIGEAPDVDQRVRAKVILVPLRSFPDDLLESVEEALRGELDVEVEVHEVVELPEAAYYKPRRRYRADELLDFLDQYAADDDTKVLGLTEVDISTTSDPYPDWGIFGLGRAPGASAVISSYRLKRKPKNREHVRFRVATVAVHEIGHTFGLPHCDEKAVECVMLDAEGGIENTDVSSGTFGPKCRRMLDLLAPL
jgi:archaemetzincin